MTTLMCNACGHSTLYSPDNVEVGQVLLGVGRRAQSQQLMHSDRVRVARAHVPGGDVDTESGHNL